jgi:hypothetical protein
MENFKRASKRLLTGALVSTVVAVATNQPNRQVVPTGSWMGTAARWVGSVKSAKVRLGTPGTGGTGWQAQTVARSALKRSASHTDSGYQTISPML